MGSRIWVVGFRSALCGSHSADGLVLAVGLRIGWCTRRGLTSKGVQSPDLKIDVEYEICIRTSILCSHSFPAFFARVWRLYFLSLLIGTPHSSSVVARSGCSVGVNDTANGLVGSGAVCGRLGGHLEALGVDDSQFEPMWHCVEDLKLGWGSMIMRQTS